MSCISIVIPTFNSEKTIESCLTTVLEQSFTDYEILIQDGGSTDNTLAILSNLKDSRIKIVSQKDLGIYDAMNKAITRSNGEWLYFLGSDDTLYQKNVLELVHERLLKSSAAIVYGDVKLIGNDGDLKGDENNFYRGYTPIEELIENNICHQAIFYRSSIIKKNCLLYDLNYPIQADHILNIKMSSRFRFEYIPLVIANFQQEGTSSRVTDDNFANDIGIIILTYFGIKLTDKKFYKYKSIIKKSAKKELMKGNIVSSIKGYLIYLKLKFN